MKSWDEEIIPSADLRNHYADISKQCKENNQTFIVTVNGRGDSVIMSYEEYKKIKAEIKFIESLKRSEDDVKNGRVFGVDEVFDNLEKQIREYKD
ncbi:MAG: type II toxin-antitoxin system Phd/YefM family antitoxin [Clostridia bacterium]|nr:type II toxin-antitoxin system Phd/YefM family antitoxin [Clostridia bacterium]